GRMAPRARWIDSTLMHSAPASLSIDTAKGPASASPSSNTRTPSSGSFPILLPPRSAISALPFPAEAEKAVHPLPMVPLWLDHPALVQAGYLLRSEAQFAIHFRIVLTQQRCRSAYVPAALAGLHRCAGEDVRPGNRVGDLDKEVACLVARVCVDPIDRV